MDTLVRGLTMTVSQKTQHILQNIHEIEITEDRYTYNIFSIIDRNSGLLGDGLRIVYRTRLYVMDTFYRI